MFGGAAGAAPVTLRGHGVWVRGVTGVGPAWLKTRVFSRAPARAAVGSGVDEGEVVGLVLTVDRSDLAVVDEAA